MKELTQLSIILILIFGALLCYGKYRCKHPNFQDPFLKKLNIGDLDGWSVIHFFEFVVLGYLFPNHAGLLTVIGILWELFEYYSGKYEPSWLNEWGLCMQTDDVWWYGKLSDIMANTLGLLIGMWARKRN